MKPGTLEYLRVSFLHAELSAFFSNKLLKAGCLLLDVIALSQPLSATEFEISRLASELNAASSHLAKQAKGGGYYSVRFSAQRLSQAAAGLVNGIRRNRSPRSSALNSAK